MEADGLQKGAGTKVSHNIYVWDRATGTLVKVLEGPKDSLDDCDVSLLSIWRQCPERRSTDAHLVQPSSGIPPNPSSRRRHLPVP